MNVLVVDNHDSFTYNLVQILTECGATPAVKVIEYITFKEASAFSKIMISPGPGLPSKKLIKFIKRISPHTSLLGVCLGHQAAAEAFGARLKRASKIFHGEAAIIKISANCELYKDLPGEINAGRYHSWVVDNKDLPEIFEITAVDENNGIMGLRHKNLDLNTVQFHPESILTPDGYKIIRNWLSINSNT